jgi:mRNA interferase RelE/StbE
VKYRVVPSRRAEKEMDKLDRVTLQRLQARLDELALDPLSPRLSKILEMGQGERSTRVGNWRIIFQVNEAAHTLEILSVYPRSKAYRKF